MGFRADKGGPVEGDPGARQSLGDLRYSCHCYMSQVRARQGRHAVRGAALRSHQSESFSEALRSLLQPPHTRFGQSPGLGEGQVAVYPPRPRDYCRTLVLDGQENKTQASSKKTELKTGS